MKLGDAIALLPHVKPRLARQVLMQARDGILEKLTEQMDSGDDDPSAGYATIALRAVSRPEFEELFLEDAWGTARVAKGKIRIEGILNFDAAKASAPADPIRSRIRKPYRQRAPMVQPRLPAR